MITPIPIIIPTGGSSNATGLEIIMISFAILLSILIMGILIYILGCILEKDWTLEFNLFENSATKGLGTVLIMSALGMMLFLLILITLFKIFGV